jgi:NAD(P)-dependent dehydrogenase (short-subunit alcohol dehydrogenase family)
MAPHSTILITGANGALGSKTAQAIAKAHPGEYHFLLLARNISDLNTVKATTELYQISPTPSFSWESLDLSSLQEMRLFTRTVLDHITSGELPSLRDGGIVNSAAVFSFATGEQGNTKDRFDLDYSVNVLASMLVVMSLLDVLEGGVVVNVGSIAYHKGTVDYFQRESKGGLSEDDMKRPKDLGLSKAFKRYGSNKLLLTMVGYALQDKLNTVSKKQQFMR